MAEFAELGMLKALADDPEDQCVLGQYHDWLIDQGREPEAASLLRFGFEGHPELLGYDWEEAFNVSMRDQIEPAYPGIKISVEPFRRTDVREVIANRVGENDGDSWVCLGSLWDGRFFFLSAWCDYTGWG